MKKKVCLAMSLLMLTGTVPAQAETIGVAEQITFTARVGTLALYRNQDRIPLDAAIYIKDGYAMLPLRAFLTSIDNGTMHWEKETKLAWMMLRGNTVACNIGKNSITVNGEPIEVSGRMDIRDGRIFVPLRNWKNILNGCGYGYGSRTATETVALEQPVAEVFVHVLAAVCGDIDVFRVELP